MASASASSSSSNKVKSCDMYPCDREGKDDLLGAPTFERAPASADMDRLGAMLDRYREELLLNPPVSIEHPEDLQWIEHKLFHEWDVICTEEKGVSVSDSFFVARCYLQCLKEIPTREIAVLDDIHDVFSRLQLLGCQHTRRCFERKDSHRDVLLLEKRVACIIVYELTTDPKVVITERMVDGLLPLDELLDAAIKPLRQVPDTHANVQQALTVAEQEKKQHELDHEKELEEEGVIVLPPVPYGEYDVNEGSYWHSDKTTVVRSFVSTAARILCNYWLEKRIFDSYRICANPPHYSQRAKDNFVAWFQKKCKNNYNDDSSKQYRDMVAEYWCPVGTHKEAKRYLSTKHDLHAPLTLLEQQLGVDSSNSLLNMARTKTSEVCKDPAHEVYEFLLLSVFCHQMQHRVKTLFVEDYMIRPGRLSEWYKRLECLKTWGQARRPLLLRILRSWMIHDGKEWILCTDLTDALMKLQTLLIQKYGGVFASGLKVGEWILEITGTPEVEMDD
jgi:hypothetical protein